ncbi:ABC-2 type transport system permease protein [Actinacidiphila yanglinensis]|uniref:Transport permease protein n=1 Tax=Actinacidiphila yanglinensis TaxID=310779 RepID=A0A1H6CCC8_9ACTN|nr:ABC transporter permease [Actinacidiphila yanglinensis]SEG70631.1 ABC-2 type transport system permease protein [Actinacidiphila yanglinensis]
MRHDPVVGAAAAVGKRPPRRAGHEPREFLLRAGVLVRHNTAVLLHEPGPLIGRLVMPLMMLLAMRPLYRAAQGPAGTAQAVVGSLVMFSLLALSVVGSSILSERAWRTWDRLRATPVRPLELLVGKAVPVLGVLAAQQAVVLGFGVVAFGMPVAAPGLLGLACVAWGLALLGMGSAVGLLARSYGQLSAVLDIGAFLLTTLGGALVPISTLPGWVRAIAPASPGYWGADCLRHAAAGDTGRTLTGVAVLLAVAVVSGSIAAWRVSRGWGRATAM